MTETVTLIIAGTESTVSADEFTIERIIAEAHSLGFQEFSVFCNDEEIEKPEDFKVIVGATYIIAAPEDAINPNDLSNNMVEEKDGVD